MTQNLKTPIPVALIGLGRMGRNHLRVLNDDSRFQVVAIVDPHATQSPIPLKSDPVFLRELQDLSDVPFDMAVVAAPTEKHYEIVTFLLQNRIHVLVEKPAASTPEQCLQLNALAKTQGVHLAVGNIERGNPALTQLVEVVKAGILGQPIHVNAVRGGRYPDAVAPGNNVVLDLAVHELDAFGLLLGDLTVVSSVCHATVTPEIFDMAQIDVRNSQGVTGTIEVNWLNPQRIRTLRLTGSHGVGVVDYMEQSCTLYGLNLRQRMTGPWNPALVTDAAGGYQEALLPVPKAEPLKVQLDRFFHLLKGEETLLCTGESMAASVRLADDAIRLSRGGFDVTSFARLQAKLMK